MNLASLLFSLRVLAIRCVTEISGEFSLMKQYRQAVIQYMKTDYKHPSNILRM